MSKIAVRIADAIYAAGRSRAGCIVTDKGTLSFAQAVDEELEPFRAALRAARPYVETCADDELPNRADDALKALDAALTL